MTVITLRQVGRIQTFARQSWASDVEAVKQNSCLVTVCEYHEREVPNILSRLESHVHAKEGLWQRR